MWAKIEDIENFSNICYNVAMVKLKNFEYSVNNLKQPEKMAEFLDWESVYLDNVSSTTPKLLSHLALIRTYLSGTHMLLTRFNDHITEMYKHTQDTVTRCEPSISFYKQKIKEYEQKATKKPELKKTYLEITIFYHKELEKWEKYLKDNLPAAQDILLKVQDIIDSFDQFFTTMVLSVIHGTVLAYRLKERNVKNVNDHITNQYVKYISIPLIQLVEKTRQFLSEILVADYNYPKTNKKIEIYTQSTEHGLIYNAELFLEYEQFRNYIAHPKKYAQELYSCDIPVKLNQIMSDYAFCIQSLVLHTRSNLQIGVNTTLPDISSNTICTNLLHIVDSIIQIAKQNANSPKYLDELDMILSAQHLQTVKYWNQIRNNYSHGKNQEQQPIPTKNDINNLKDILLEIQQHFEQYSI